MSSVALPASWTWADLGDLVEVLDHRRVPVNRQERETRHGDVPYYGAAGQVGWIDDYLFDEDLVLLGEDGVQFFDPLAQKAYIVKGRSWVNNHAHVLRPRSGISHEFLCEALNAVSYVGAANGTTRLKLTKTAMLSLKVPLPPKGEQRRLVSHLSAVRSSVAAGTRRFETALAALDTFRSSLLQELLDRHPAGSATTLSAVAQIASGITKGRKTRDPLTAQPFLRAANLRDGWLDLSEVKYIEVTEGEAQRYKLEPGDVLLVEGSGSPGRLGQGWLWEGQVSNCLHQNHVFRARPETGVIMPRYLAWSMQTPAAKSYFRSIAKTTSGLATINKRQVSDVPVTLLPLEQQSTVLAELDRPLSTASAYGDHLRGVLARATDFERALRYRAFSGQLTARELGEGSGHDLLAELNGERQDTERATKRTRKSGKARVTGSKS
jgi:type I restriction enzyme S subunit